MQLLFVNLNLIFYSMLSKEEVYRGGENKCYVQTAAPKFRKVPNSVLNAEQK